VRVWLPGKGPPASAFFEGTLAITLLPGAGASDVESLALSWNGTTAAGPMRFDGIGLHRRGSTELSAGFWPVTGP
jgi:hypothetical protein